MNDRPVTTSTPYREAIGSLVYSATISRPDISFAVNYLSRTCNKPMLSHWKGVKRVFQYLKGTKNCGTHFDGDRNLLAYTDSDYGGDMKTGHLTSGELLKKGRLILRYSQKQRLVAISPPEAEYRAAIFSIDDICLIRRIGLELEGLTSHESTT